MLPLLRHVPSRLSARLLRLSVSPLSRLLSTAESHPDFAPRAKAAPAPDAVFERVRALVASKPVVLFMKGSPSAPQCGFSAQVVRVLTTHGVGIHGEDVLRDASLRSSMKDFSKWPTFPQVRAGRCLAHPHGRAHHLRAYLTRTRDKSLLRSCT